MKSLSHVRLFATPWTVAYQVPPSIEFSRQEYWSGLPFPSPGDFPDPGIEPGSPALQADALPSEPPGNRCGYIFVYFSWSFLYFLEVYINIFHFKLVKFWSSFFQIFFLVLSQNSLLSLYPHYAFVVVQSLSRVQLFVIL